MHVPIQDMTIVIRSAGERTLPACQALVRELVGRAGGNPDRQVVVIAERPFAAAVRRTFEIGLEERREWVVGMDADVMLLEDGLERIGAMCACADGATFTVATLILCKMYGGFCFMGIHGYPRRLLERALGVMDGGGIAESLRPESAVARAMGERGFKAFAPPVPVGIHDFEQWRRHIYLKMRLRARRWAADAGGGSDTSFADHLTFVDRMASGDSDYLVASWGLRDGQKDALAVDAPARYDWDCADPGLAERMDGAGIDEKAPWVSGAGALAERVIVGHDYALDQRTPRWIRERFGFASGAAQALQRIGVVPAGVGTVGRAWSHGLAGAA